jgi:hypothetical protein
MNKSILFKNLRIICFVLSIFFFIISVVAHRDKISALIFGVFCFILYFGFTYVSHILKKKEGLSAPLASQSADNIPIIDTMATNNTQVIIPDTCPHCKNPNTKRIRLCEWCGNQIV